VAPSETERRPFRVVVTRDTARVAPLATRLASHGAEVVPLPVTRTEPPDVADWSALVEHVRRIADYDAVVVASSNAAEALVRAVREAHVAIGRPVVAVGPATGAALARRGLDVEIAARRDSEGVAEHVLARGARRVLWPRPESGREEGIQLLRAGGAEVDAPVAYRTVVARGDDRAVIAGLDALAGADVVCVYAPSQVAALAELLAARGAGLEALAGAAVVAIGETTAAALRAHGVTVAAVPFTPDLDAMASAIVAVYPPGS
jgi:uroporphyrinogen-III synthase